MKLIFKFDFDDNSSQSFGFEMFLPENASEEDKEDFSGELFDQLFDDYDDIENEFGVHDFSGSEDGETVLVGFNSYEVNKKRIHELMNAWRDKAGEIGIKTGRIKRIKKLVN